MKFNQEERSSNNAKVANITLGKDELKLIWSMAKLYSKQTPKIIGNMATISRLQNVEKECAKIIKTIWDERPGKWRDPSMYKKADNLNTK